MATTSSYVILSLGLLALALAMPSEEYPEWDDMVPEAEEMSLLQKHSAKHKGKHKGKHKDSKKDSEPLPKLKPINPRGSRAAAEAAAALYHGHARSVRVRVGVAKPGGNMHGTKATINDGEHHVEAARNSKHREKAKVKVDRKKYNVKFLKTGKNKKAELRAKERSRKEYRKVKEAKRKAHSAEKTKKRAGSVPRSQLRSTTSMSLLQRKRQQNQRSW